MWSIFDQDSTSGITWHLVSSGIDCGDIIIQKSIPLDSTYTYLKLTQEQLQLAFLAFREICDSLLSWNLPLKTQEKSVISYCTRQEIYQIMESWIYIGILRKKVHSCAVWIAAKATFCPNQR